MIKYYITIISNNFNSLNTFFFYFFFFNTVKYKIINKYKIKKRKKKVITILKSPHIYKSSQETFYYKIHLKKITLFAANISQVLIFNKKIKTIVCSDIKIKIKFSVNLINNIKAKIFNSDNFKFIVFKKFFTIKNFKNIAKQKTCNLIRLSDMYGQILKQSSKKWLSGL